MEIVEIVSIDNFPSENTISLIIMFETIIVLNHLVYLQNGVQDIKGLSHIVMESTGKTYLLTVIMIFLICIMLLGILCGRVTKRVSRQRKML